MMYANLPKAQRRAIKGTLTLAWMFAGGAGVSAVVAAPTTIITEIGTLLTYLAGAVLAASSFVAALSVVTGRYRWEWVASWLAAAALVPYLTTVWALCLTGEWGRATQAFLISSLLTFFVCRGILCSAHAAKLRAAHKAGTGAVEQALSEGEGNDPDAHRLG